MLANQLCAFIASRGAERREEFLGDRRVLLERGLASQLPPFVDQRFDEIQVWNAVQKNHMVEARGSIHITLNIA